MESVHDNEVYAYSVLLPDRRVILHTLFNDTRGSTYTDVVFSGVALHQFENAGGSQWVLSDIVDEHPMQFYENHAPAISQFDVGLPFQYRNVGEFMSGLLERNLSCFDVRSSIGLRGFLIAERCEQVRRESACIAP